MGTQLIFDIRIDVSIRLLTALVLGACATGCNRSVLPTQVVSGEVTLDDVRVAEGLIAFVPEDTTTGARTCEGKIVDGKYSFRVNEGKSRVEISALGIGKNPIIFEGVPLKSNVVPERYNEQSELTADVTSNKTTFDYSLTSK